MFIKLGRSNHGRRRGEVYEMCDAGGRVATRGMRKNAAERESTITYMQNTVQKPLQQE
jgi:hypothetical protein